MTDEPFDDHDGGWIVRETAHRCTKCDDPVPEEIGETMDRPLCVGCFEDIFEDIVETLRIMYEALHTDD